MATGLIVARRSTSVYLILRLWLLVPGLKQEWGNNMLQWVLCYFIIWVDISLMTVTGGSNIFPGSRKLSSSWRQWVDPSFILVIFFPFIGIIILAYFENYISYFPNGNVQIFELISQFLKTKLSVERFLREDNYGSNICFPLNTFSSLLGLMTLHFAAEDSLVLR